MSIQDESAGGKPKRIQRPLTKEQWQLARTHFESSGQDITAARIAQIFNTSLSMVQKHAAAEKWSKTSNIVADARKQLQSETQRQITIATEQAGKEIAKSLLDDLQPFIEREKRTQIQRSIKRSRRAQRRIDKLSVGYDVVDSKTGELRRLSLEPKDEMHIATAEDKYDSIIRRNLGMNDSVAVGGAINVPILINQAAIQVNSQS